MENVNHIVYSADLSGHPFVEQNKTAGIACHAVMDARSAVYYATGISAQNKETVMVCISAGNASRSAFSGMTEAYYRKLPVVLVTFGQALNYQRELADVIYSHYIVDDIKEINDLLHAPKPMHIEVRPAAVSTKKRMSFGIDELVAVLSEDDYLYFGSGVSYEGSSPCKTVFGGMNGCGDGAVANVLGASLAHKRRRYVGVITEEEFLHDMNSLGNINANDSLLYVVLCQNQNALVANYAAALGYTVVLRKHGEITPDFWASVLSNKKKSVVVITEE